MKSILDREFKEIWKHHIIRFDVIEPSSYWNRKNYIFSAEFPDGDRFVAEFDTKEEAQKAYDIMVECNNAMIKAPEEAKKKIAKIAKKLK